MGIALFCWSTMCDFHSQATSRSKMAFAVIVQPEERRKWGKRVCVSLRVLPGVCTIVPAYITQDGTYMGSWLATRRLGHMVFMTNGYVQVKNLGVLFLERKGRMGIWGPQYIKKFPHILYIWLQTQNFWYVLPRYVKEDCSSHSYLLGQVSEACTNIGIHFPFKADKVVRTPPIH